MAKKKKNQILPPDINPEEFAHHPHDRYTRYVLQIKELAIEFLQFALDESIQSFIDWDTLEIAKDTFIDEKLKANYTDICYTGISKTQIPFRIASLIEHKSEIPKTGETLHQLGRYINSIHKEDLNQDRDFTLVIPILLYHGSKSIAKDIPQTIFRNVPLELLRFAPCFDYVLIDLSSRSDEDLEALNKIIIGKFLLTLKNSRDEKYLMLYWQNVFNFALENEQSTLVFKLNIATAVYLNTTSNVFNEILNNMENTISAPGAKSFKPYLLELYEKGMEKGMEKPIQIFMKKNPTWTDSQVAEFFEVSPSFVKQLREQAAERKVK